MTKETQAKDTMYSNMHHAVRLIAIFACVSLSTLLMNQTLFPLYDAVFTFTRDISIITSAIILIIIALITRVHPSYTNGIKLTIASVILGIVGTIIVVLSLSHPSTASLVIGASIAAASRSWAIVCASLFAISVIQNYSINRVLTCVPLGYLVASALDIILLQYIPNIYLAIMAIIVLPLLIIIFTYRSNSLLFKEISSSIPATDLSVTRPLSFLPLTSTIYILQFIVFIAFGFALRFGEIEGVPLSGQILSFVVLALLVLYIALRRDPTAYDQLFDIVVILLVTGLSLASIGAHDSAYLANSILMAGNALYNVLVSCTLIALANRNRLNAIAVFCWASGLASLGTSVGAYIGVESNRLVLMGAHDLASYLAVAVILALLSYVLFALRGFSFTDTIKSVTDPEPNASVSPTVLETFDQRCDAISQHYGLTEREQEVFALLARGDDRASIESGLSITRNTVKAHVKHIYEKLGVHSHQELLDLIENAQTNIAETPQRIAKKRGRPRKTVDNPVS